MVKTRIRVLYADTDQMGVVYYANFLRYFEAGRTECLRAHGIVYAEAEKTLDIRLPVVEASVRYAQPGRYDDELDIATTIAHVGTGSMRFEYQVLRGATVLAHGHTIHACIDGQGKVRKLPDDLAQRLTPENHGPV